MPREYRDKPLPNEVQIGGTHYQEEVFVCPECGRKHQHWDIAWGLRWDSFMYPITKYLWRWKRKGGLKDLQKAKHYLEKYISVLEEEQENDGEPTSAYTNQDRG